MAQKINLKIPVKTVLERIEAKISETEKLLADYKKNYPSLLKKYEKEQKEYEEAFRKYIFDYLIANAKEFAENYKIRIYKRNPEFIVPLSDELDKMPKSPLTVGEFELRNSSYLKELKEAQSLLKMTTQEEISSSSYSNIMNYIL